MKKPKAYLTFIEINPSPSGKTKRWLVYASLGQVALGTIKWFAPWRRYTFDPIPSTTFDAACLTEISNFLTQTNIR